MIDAGAVSGHCQRDELATDATAPYGFVRGNWVDAALRPPYPARLTKRDPFKYFKTSREIIRLAVMMYVRFPLSLRNVEDLLHERGIDVSHESVR